MGQKLGKPTFVPGVEPFLNLPSKSVGRLWEVYTLLSDGWGLSESAFFAVCKRADLGAVLGLGDKELQDVGAAFFKVLDTDKNGMVDALELMGTLIVISGMDPSQKLQFAFKLYDFNKTGNLTLDELALALQSTAIGLCKITSLPEPNSSTFETLAELILNRTLKTKDGRIALGDILGYCQTDPTAISWIAYFDDLQDEGTRAALGGIDIDKDIHVDIDLTERLKTTPIEDDTPIITPKAGAASQSAAEPSSAAATTTSAWQATAATLKPSEPPPEINTPPNSELNLEWVYGYGGKDARSNLRYTATGDIVYHTASLGVAYRKPTEERAEAIQEFNMEQHGEILSFAISPDLTKVATGEVGHSPSIVVWDASTMKTLVVLSGLHKNGVIHLDFSADSRLLLSIGKDDDYSLIVYDWATGTKVYSARVSRDPVFDARFASGGYSMATSGKKGVSFWLPKGPKSWARQKGIFGKKAPAQPIVALTNFAQPYQFIGATSNGQLLLWEGRNCTQVVQAHDQIITTMTFHNKRGVLLTASKDKRIKLWSSDFLPMAIIDTLLSASTDPLVRSLALSDDGRRVLVGTKGGEVFEVSAVEETTGTEGEEEGGGGIKLGMDLNGGALVAGHATGKIWSLAMNGPGGEVATVGEDRTLRVWDMVAHKPKKVTSLDSTGRAVCFSPDGTSVAIAMGAGKEEKELREGNVMILNLETMAETAKFTDSKSLVVDVKYSNDGAQLGAASTDGTVYLYRLNENEWSLKHHITGQFEGPVTRLDFSSDGQWVRVNGKGQLKFFNTQTGEEPKKLSKMKNVPWDSETCLYTYQLQGLTSSSALREPTAVHAASAPLMAAVDAGGRVKLYNYPVVSASSLCKSFPGHSADITGVRFGPNDSHVFTTGGGDHALFQWALEVDETPESAEEDNGKEVEEEEELEEEEEEEEGKPKPKAPVESDLDEDLLDGDVLERGPVLSAFLSEDNQEAIYALQDAVPVADKFSAVASFKSQYKAPTQEPPEYQAPPDDNLSLQWVYGYSGQVARSNVFYNTQDDIIYPAATVGIVYNKVDRNQRHFRLHTDSITASAQHPDRSHVATGQKGHRPLVFIWDTNTMKAVRVISLKPGSRAVSALAFSPDGQTLALAVQDDRHSVFLYDWNSGVLKSRGDGGPNKVLALSFSPDNKKLLQGGINHFKLWQVKGRSLTAKQGLYGHAVKKQTILSVGWWNNEGLLGGASGKLFTLEGRKIGANVIDAHRKGLTSLYTYTNTNAEGNTGTWVITGGKDGKIKVFDQDLNEVSKFKVPAYHDTTTSKLAVGVRAVTRNADGRKILVGTSGGNILELSAADGSDINNGPLVTGHWKHSLQGLATHPVRNEFVTVGGDRMVRLWSMEDRRQINSLAIGEVGRAISFAPNGLFLAVGVGTEDKPDTPKTGGMFNLGFVGNGGAQTPSPSASNGSVLIISLMEEALRVVNRKQDTKSAINDIKFTPNGKLLVAGSDDGKLYLYDVLNNFKLKATSESCNSPVMKLDVSTDSKYVIAFTGGNEIRYFDSKNAEFVQDGVTSLKNESWSTTTGHLGYNVRGIYRDLAKVDHVRGVGLAHDGKLLATGDEYGKVSIFRYPAPTVGASCKRYGGHACHVSGVCFSIEGDYLISIGEEDRCAFQWKRESVPEVKDIAGSSNIPDKEIKDELSLDITNVASSAAVPSEDGMLLVPDYALGYNGRDVRSNLGYNAEGSLVYYIARLGVVYDKATATQLFYQGHGRDVGALALSSDGSLAMTAERGQQPRAHVWDALSGKDLAVLPVAHRGDIKYLAFAPDGKSAVSLGLEGGKYHSLAVYQTANGLWTDALLVAKTQIDRQQQPLFVLFPNLTQYQVVTGGINHITFWTVVGHDLSTRKGNFAKSKVKPQVLLNAAVLEDRIITGTQTGQLCTWRDVDCTKAVTAHEGPVLSLVVATAKSCVITASIEGLVKIWDRELILVKTINLALASPGPPASTIIRSLAVDANITKIAVGLKSNEVYETVVDTVSTVRVLQGFSDPRITLITSHPTNPDLYATLSRDEVTIRIVSISEKKILASAVLPGVGSQLVWHPTAHVLIASMGVGAAPEGGFALLSGKDLSILQSVGEFSTNSAPLDMVVTPDGSSLALVFSTGQIAVFDLSEDGKHAKKAFGFNTDNNKYVEAGSKLRYSKSGEVLRLVQGANKRLYFNVHTGAVIGDAPPKGCEWPDESVTPYTISTTPHGAVILKPSQGRPLVAKGHKGPVASWATTTLNDKNNNKSGYYLLTAGATDGTTLHWKLLAE